VVFDPLWVLTVLHSPVALGYVGGAFAVRAILGNVVFTALAPYLRRYPTLVLGYMIGGAPRFLILALSDDLRVVIAVSFVSGLAMCSVNPTIGAMIYQRVPSAMLARVGGIMAAVAFAGMPIGGVLGGLAAERLGLTNGILLISVLYFVVSLSPIIRHRLWRELDDVPMAKRPIDHGARVHWTYGRLRSAIGPRVTVHYVRGDWTASARHGLRPLARRQPIRAKVVLNGLAQLDVPAVHDAVGAVLRNDQARAELQTKRMRAQVREIESKLSEIGFGLDRRLLPRDIAS
jgi:MFS family permease